MGRNRKSVENLSGRAMQITHYKYMRKNEDDILPVFEEIDPKEHDYIVKNAKTLDTGVYWQPLFNSID